MLDARYSVWRSENQVVGLQKILVLCLTHSAQLHTSHTLYLVDKLTDATGVRLDARNRTTNDTVRTDRVSVSMFFGHGFMHVK